MSQAVRLCFLKGLGGAYELDERAEMVNSVAMKYTGPLSDAMNLLYEGTFGHDLLNYTVVKKSSIGIFNATSGYYDEDSCLYSMQTNESDFGFATPLYPVQGENLVQENLYFSDITHLFSSYEVSARTYDSDVMGVFMEAFSIGFWFMFTLVSLVFWFLIKLHVRMERRLVSRRKRDDSLYQMLTHMFQVETIDYEGPSIRIASLFASTFSFFVFACFTNSMKTDIVVVEEPNIVRNYDDLLRQQNLRLIFPMFGDVFRQFSLAPRHTKERQAFEKSLKYVGDEKEMFLYPAGMDMLQLIDFLRDVGFEKNRRSVGLLLEIYTSTARNFACILKVLLSRSVTNKLKDEGMTFYTWASKDADARDSILTLAHSAFYQTPYLAKIYKRVTRLSNMGFEQMFQRHIAKMPTGVVTIKGHDEGDMYRNCLADDYRQNLPHVECAPFTPKQFKALVITCGVILLLSLVAFFCENRKQRRRNRKLAMRFAHKRRAARSNQMFKQVEPRRVNGRPVDLSRRYESMFKARPSNVETQMSWQRARGRLCQLTRPAD